LQPNVINLTKDLPATIPEWTTLSFRPAGEIFRGLQGVPEISAPAKIPRFARN